MPLYVAKKLAKIKVYEDNGVNNDDVGNDWANLSNVDITQTFKTGNISIVFTGRFNIITANTQLTIRIEIDGTPKANSGRSFECFNANQICNIATSWVEAITAGSHTITVEAICGGSGADSHEWQLTVIEIPD